MDTAEAQLFGLHMVQNGAVATGERFGSNSGWFHSVAGPEQRVALPVFEGGLFFAVSLIPRFRDMGHTAAELYHCS